MINFRNLKDNWNTYQAKPFKESLLLKAESLYEKLPIKPIVFPTGRNSIQFEFVSKDGDYLEFEIYEDKIEMYLIKPPLDIEKEIVENEMIDYLNLFYEKSN